jgi:hypothetical protein
VSRVSDAFNVWIITPDGQRVLSECLKRALELKRRGVSRYSIDGLFQSIRYDWKIGLLGDGEYRLNDHHRPFMARLLMRIVPDLGGFFETRNLRGRA